MGWHFDISSYTSFPDKTIRDGDGLGYDIALQALLQTEIMVLQVAALGMNVHFNIDLLLK